MGRLFRIVFVGGKLLKNHYFIIEWSIVPGRRSPWWNTKVNVLLTTEKKGESDSKVVWREIIAFSSKCLGVPAPPQLSVVILLINALTNRWTATLCVCHCYVSDVNRLGNIICYTAVEKNDAVETSWGKQRPKFSPETTFFNWFPPSPAVFLFLCASLMHVAVGEGRRKIRIFGWYTW